MYHTHQDNGCRVPEREHKEPESRVTMTKEEIIEILKTLEGIKRRLHIVLKA